MPTRLVPVLLAWVSLVLLGGCATGHPRGSAGGFPGRTAEGSPVAQEQNCLEGVAWPAGWPDLSSSDTEALLAPFLACASLAEFMELQCGVDMPRLVEALDDWRAVRLGALGPLGGAAAEVLNRKRAAFVVQATREYGVARAEVFALFVLHSASDDELRQVLALMAGDKRLGETLGRMDAVREELARRGLRLSDYKDRPERLGDVARGLARAADDALSTSEVRQGVLAQQYYSQRGQLPEPYQQALQEVERVQLEQHFSPGNVLLGSFDTLTFGVPLGFYYLSVGTGHGAYSLTQGQYEQAARALAPAALLVALYAGGKGLRSFSEARDARVAGLGAGRRFPAPELRFEGLKEVAERLRERLGMEGIRELARYIQANREAAAFVGAGGEPAAAALYEARGDVAKAQVWLSQAKPQRAGPTAARAGAGKSPGSVASMADDTARPSLEKASAGMSQGSVASLVDEAVGLSPEVVEAKLQWVERETTGPRLSADVAVLEKHRPSLDAPLPGAEGNPRWGEYVAYFENRLAERRQGKAVEGPLRWEAYEQMRGLFARGLAFERAMVALLRADAAQPRALRRFLLDFDRPRVETYVGVWKQESGLRFADVLVIEEGQPSGPRPRVETFSFKSRNLSMQGQKPLTAQMTADASVALRYYGGTLDIRRSSLKHLLGGGSEVPVQRVRLIYEGGDLKPKKENVKAAAEEVGRMVKGVEVLFQ